MNFRLRRSVLVSVLCLARIGLDASALGEQPERLSPTLAIRRLPTLMERSGMVEDVVLLAGKVDGFWGWRRQCRRVR